MDDFERLENKYNPEHDIPDGVVVSWADYELVQICREQELQISQLKVQVSLLTSRLDEAGL
ncbi:hypothetical protein H6F75_00305 [Nodosilinea sp. FACHB-131]|uniref:hypothetical protein n=1 Tax=Cyanophyceae TaxID=3028117 RepID=UPI0016886B13|nr:hypothetical protein [Nodosilinea sp. FACHB-131]MBD1871911.1 hypothetical protein [Nodosilinea sp. FACHB-131]